MGIYSSVTITRQYRNSRVIYTNYRSSFISKLITNYL